ncbi:TPA: cyclic nucleotide-binding domain-containing protein, partial [Candidatus Poribacteria bacterium]|nr:cyclic nucleotide-binding domain-containing protein [Candidatus Poribacteria bacterium]
MKPKLFDKITFLKTTNLFAETPESLLMQISDSMQEIEMKRGTTIFCEGDVGDAIYLVVHGTVGVEKNGIKLVTRSSGECFGEFALLDERPRSASAIAETDALLLRLEQKDFQKAISQTPKLAYTIFKILTGKLRQDVAVQVEAAREQERWRQDIRRAQEIQMAMLPQSDLSTEKIEISGYCRPAADVGGDYYDYLLLSDDKLAIIICDVTGHGFYSGLFVAMAKSCLHTQAKIDYSVEKIMEAMNRTVSFSMQSGLLITCCYIIMDFQNRILSYSNAGHPYPYHYSQSTDSLERLVSTDMLLGIPGFEESKFTKEERKWGKGDLLLLYSDGITEAEDANEEPFGDERLEKIILEKKGESATYIKDYILNAIS